PGDLRSDRRDAGRSKNTSNQSHNQKHESVIQHSHTSLSLPNKAEDVPFGFVLMDQSFVGKDTHGPVADRCTSVSAPSSAAFDRRGMNFDLFKKEGLCSDQSLKTSTDPNMPIFSVTRWRTSESSNRRPTRGNSDIGIRTETGRWERR